jgi:bifunctional DNA-binding transcriptional regulator/antitoxin component of YhaV-PrlF toxin-antitoxin module
MTLPRSVREWLGVREGDHVAFVRSGADIVMRPLTRTVLDLRGTVKVDGPQDFDAIREELRRRRAEERAADAG